MRPLLFAPLGAMWAFVASHGRSTGVRRLILLVGFVLFRRLASAIEAAQVLMPSKIVDSTDALLCLVGAAGGLYLTTGLLAARQASIPCPQFRVPVPEPMVAPAEREETDVRNCQPREDQPIVEVLVKRVIRRLCGSLAAATSLLVALTAAQKPQQTARFVVQHDWVGKGQWIRGDTHVHTRFSDGGHSPAEVADAGGQVRMRGHRFRRPCRSQAQGRGRRSTFAAIQAVRKTQPALAVIAGLEWNVPPFGGDEHATLLVPEGPREEPILAEFKRRFDDYESLKVRRSPTFRPR